MTREGLKEFIEMLTPQYKAFAAHLILIIDKIEQEKKTYQGRFEA